MEARALGNLMKIAVFGTIPFVDLIKEGFIKLGHSVLEISDRDITHYNKSITDFDGKRNLNNFAFAEKYSWHFCIAVYIYCSSEKKGVCICLVLMIIKRTGSI